LSEEAWALLEAYGWRNVRELRNVLDASWPSAATATRSVLRRSSFPRRVAESERWPWGRANRESRRARGDRERAPDPQRQSVRSGAEPRRHEADDPPLQDQEARHPPRSTAPTARRPRPAPRRHLPDRTCRSLLSSWRPKLNGRFSTTRRVRACRRPPEELSMVQELMKGLSITLSHFFKKPVTLQYPEQRMTMFPRFRGLHELHRYANGLERCVCCGLCARFARRTPSHGRREQRTERYSAGGATPSAMRSTCSAASSALLRACRRTPSSSDTTALRRFARRVRLLQGAAPRPHRDDPLPRNRPRTLMRRRAG
jgi:hypothetical protein